MWPISQLCVGKCRMKKFVQSVESHEKMILGVWYWLYPNGHTFSETANLNPSPNEIHESNWFPPLIISPVFKSSLGNWTESENENKSYATSKNLQCLLFYITLLSEIESASFFQFLALILNVDFDLVVVDFFLQLEAWQLFDNLVLQSESLLCYLQNPPLHINSRNRLR